MRTTLERLCVAAALAACGASAQTLDEIQRELEKPLPKLEEVDPKVVEWLQRPLSIRTAEGANWSLFFYPLLWGAVLGGIGYWYRAPIARALEPRRREAVATTDVVGPAEPAEPAALSREELQAIRELTHFGTWPELLRAARAGNRSAREVLATAPGHPAAAFTLESAEFKRHLALTRNLTFSADWVAYIVGLLRRTEVLSQVVRVTSPLGVESEVLLDALTAELNRVLGYENLRPELRRELELRRWILLHTRQEGLEQPAILQSFFTRQASGGSARTAASAPGKLASAVRKQG